VARRALAKKLKNAGIVNAEFFGQTVYGAIVALRMIGLRFAL